jgi:5'(3')-deoxyribonucleotidase
MMINPASVAFDIDGVVADTMTLFLDIARQRFDIDSMRYDDITCYNIADCLDIDAEVIDAIVTSILDGNYSAPLNPLPGAPEVLTQLGRNYGPLIFVTARPYVGPIRNWIDQTLCLDPASVEIITTGSHEAKADILQKRKISYFIEDRLETCFMLQDAGVQPVLFKQPWNRVQHPFVEVGSWDELQAIIAI